MGQRMRRGKGQILREFLPGRTFDFDKTAAIARVQSVRATPVTNLSTAFLLRKVAEEARAWQPAFRPALRDETLDDPSRFILLDPRAVQADLYPKVFWCQNPQCRRVIDLSNSDPPPNSTCRVCNTGRLIQLRWVKVHRCGALQPLTPPSCQKCHSNRQMALDTRGSERIREFVWICRTPGCNTRSSIFGGMCRSCQWPGGGDLQHMDIEVHRAKSTYFIHNASVLNIPHNALNAFLNHPDWRIVAAAKFLEFPEVLSRPLSDFSPTVQSSQELDPGLSADDLNEIMNLPPEQIHAAMEARREQRRKERQGSSPSAIRQNLLTRTGVTDAVWEHSGQELLEAVMATQLGRPRPAPPSAEGALRRLGLRQLKLVPDFPVINATYGYSRVDYAPDACWLNPFPAEQDHDGKFPVYIDEVEADALVLQLEPTHVWAWLEANDVYPLLPNGTDPKAARRAHFVELLATAPLRQTLDENYPEARLVFGLLHTLAHLSLRQAALISGLETTSLSEYILPRALMFGVYCNHRFGATIGALTAVFEQSLEQWLAAIADARRCVYDPVCYDRQGNCHACTHLAETSCRFFNLNLGRSYLFGGPDPVLGRPIKGFLEVVADRHSRGGA